MIDQITTKSGGAARIKGNGAYYVFYSGYHYKQIQSYLSIYDKNKLSIGNKDKRYNYQSTIISN